MDIKLILAIISIIIGVGACYPYLRDIFSNKTKPHAYSWLIWAITQGVAFAGILHGGGAWGVASDGAFTLLAVLLFMLSFKYGTKNITKSDTVILIFALLSIVVWVQLDQSLLAVIMVTIIDVLGYIPTIRKTYIDPWSETLESWFAFAISNLLSLFALSEYNAITLTYVGVVLVVNMVISTVCFLRRRKLRMS